MAEDIAKFRNIGIIAHIDAGKTTATEAMLYYSGRSHRIGDIDEGTTVMDYLPEERDRGITIAAAAASFPWGKELIHLIDTPGHIDFTAEVERSLRVIDGAVVIFSGVEGVEAQSEKVWHQADNYGVPKIAFINKLDRVGASFSRVTEEINNKFNDCGLPVQLPLGEEAAFDGVIDLISMEMCRFSGELQEEVVRQDIPEDQFERAEEYREYMIEKLADYDNDIAELYLEGEQIPPSRIQSAVRAATLANSIVPILAGSAKKRIGIQPLLDATTNYLPSPLDTGEITGWHPKEDKEVTVSPDPSESFSGLVFKVVAGKSADVLYVRTYSGKLKAGSTYYNPRTGKKVRANQVLRLYARNTTSVEEVGPGDIAGLIGPKDCGTGDTICEMHRQVVFERMTFPEPVISMAVEPRSRRDKDKLAEGLDLLAKEDPTLSVAHDEETGQRLISGMGELHLQINLKRLSEDFGVETRAGEPRVSYRERLTGETTVHSKFERCVAEKELYAEADVYFSLVPTDASERIVVENECRKDKNIPKEFLDAAERALEQGFRTGGRFGYAMIYSKAVLKNLTIDPSRTTEGAVVGAMLNALDQAIQQVGTTVLEPIMFLEIVAPEDSVGDIITYLQPKRAIIHEMEPAGTVKKFTCNVPLAEMFGFGKDLPKLSGGRASFTMEPSGYQEVPREIAETKHSYAM